MNQPEWFGSIFTGTKPLTNRERLALWLLKQDGPLFFNHWKRGWWH